MLAAGANQVKVRAVLDAGIDYSFFAVDSIDIDYQRVDHGGRRHAAAEAAAKGTMPVDGLTDPTPGCSTDQPADPQDSQDHGGAGGTGGATWVTF